MSMWGKLFKFSRLAEVPSESRHFRDAINRRGGTIVFVIASIVSVVAVGGAQTAEAELYVLRDRRGVITFTSRKPKEGTRYETFKPSRVALSYYRLGRAGKWGPPRPRTTVYDSLIAKVAIDHKLDPALVKAVVHVESAFQPTARSYKGAVGLMQLMPETAKRFGVKNSYHPEENLNGGTKYLRWLLERYKGDIRLALAAYNAGEEAVDRYGGIPPYAETQEYVRRVTETHRVYRCVGTTTKC